MIFWDFSIWDSGFRSQAPHPVPPYLGEWLSVEPEAGRRWLFCSGSSPAHSPSVHRGPSLVPAVGLLGFCSGTWSCWCLLSLLSVLGAPTWLCRKWAGLPKPGPLQKGSRCLKQGFPGSLSPGVHATLNALPHGLLCVSHLCASIAPLSLYVGALENKKHSSLSILSKWPVPTSGNIWGT